MTLNQSLNILSPDELESELRFSHSKERYSPIGDFPYLLIDLTPGNASFRVSDDVDAQLSDLPCPIIGLVTRSDQSIDGALSRRCDLQLDSLKEVGHITENISNAPLTAMTLVQLLRHNENANLRDALMAESMAYATLQGGIDFHRFIQSREKPAIALSPDDNANSQPAVLIKRDENTLLITLNRPENRNAFSIEMRDALIEALQLVEGDESIEEVIINGAGACFCIGGDLSEFGQATDTAEAHCVRSTRSAGRLLSRLSERIEFQLHSACIGAGIELPAFAQRVVAKEKTHFQLPEITMGLIPGAGGTVSILNRIGRKRTAYLALSAKRINARTALSWGLIDDII